MPSCGSCALNFRFHVCSLHCTCSVFGTHRILKWPIFIFLALLIWVDFVLYVVVRTLIFLFSRADTPLKDATDYKSWLTAARKADVDEGRDQWRHEEKSRDYDWAMVKATTQRLRKARESGDAESLMRTLLLSLKNSAFGELDFELYIRTRVGTKALLEEYRDEVCRSLRWLASEACLPAEALAARREFCSTARTALGGCALVLSGGCTFGIFHFGVVKGLLELGHLPPVVCGASAGAVIASVVCTRTEDELRHVLSDQDDLFREMGPAGPLHGSLLWKLMRILRHGKIYNAADFQEHMHWFARGYTFREAYQKTGRVLNISATPVRSRGRRAVPLQLNHISTPHVDIASAVCASACVPMLIEPVELLEKSPDGTLRPYHPAETGPDGAEGERIRMRDGSFESDVPLEALAATFGATFTIVSQVNPHVAPFYAHLQGRAGRPSGGRDRTGAWRGGFLLGALEVSLKEDMKTHLRTLKKLQLGSSLLGVDWSNLWLQPQDGSVVLTPVIRLRHWAKVLSNLDHKEELSSMIAHMERCVWEASSLIRARMDVQKALDEAHTRFCGPDAEGRHTLQQPPPTPGWPLPVKLTSMPSMRLIAEANFVRAAADDDDDAASDNGKKSGKVSGTITRPAVSTAERRASRSSARNAGDGSSRPKTSPARRSSSRR